MRRSLTLLGVVLATSATAASADPSSAPSRPALTFTRLGQKATGHDSVWVAAADGSAARQVTANGDDSTLSPDGRWLTFERGQDLFLVDLVTRKTQPLGETSRNERWAPVGARLAVSQPRGFFLVDAVSGSREKLLAKRVTSFDFTPDADSIVLTLGRGVASTSNERSDLFRLRLRDLRLERLTHDGHSRSPLVTRTGIAYVRFKNAFEAPEVWLIGTDGHGPRLLARCCESKTWLSHGDATRGYETVAASRAGTRVLACGISTVDCFPLAIDLQNGRRHFFPEVGKIIPPQQTATALDLSADGRKVLVVVGPPHDGPGRWRLWAVPFTGGAPTPLAQDAIGGRWRR